MYLAITQASLAYSTRRSIGVLTTQADQFDLGHVTTKQASGPTASETNLEVGDFQTLII